jgi:hypothetical protein
VKTEILSNGDLCFTLESNEEKEEVSEFGHAWERILGDCIGGCSPLIGNGWECVAPETIGALTDAPIVSDDVGYDDDGTINHVGRVWWFPNYMVENPVETLATTGRVVFTLAGAAR